MDESGYGNGSTSMILMKSNLKRRFNRPLIRLREEGRVTAAEYPFASERRGEIAVFLTPFFVDNFNDNSIIGDFLVKNSISSRVFYISVEDLVQKIESNQTLLDLFGEIYTNLEIMPLNNESKLALLQLSERFELFGSIKDELESFSSEAIMDRLEVGTRGHIDSTLRFSNSDFSESLEFIHSDDCYALSWSSNLPIESLVDKIYKTIHELYNLSNGYVIRGNKFYEQRALQIRNTAINSTDEVTFVRFNSDEDDVVINANIAQFEETDIYSHEVSLISSNKNSKLLQLLLPKTASLHAFESFEANKDELLRRMGFATKI